MIEYILLILLEAIILTDLLITIRRKKSVWKRIVFYSFIIYILNVYNLTIGPIIWPPWNEIARWNLQPIPLYFIQDWISMYRSHGLDWFFWNSVKLTFYNLLLLAPLGVYLRLLFSARSWKRAVLIAFLSSLFIETTQLILSYLGMSTRTFNIDDLILNTLGGAIGFLIGKWVEVKWKKRFIKGMENSSF